MHEIFVTFTPSKEFTSQMRKMLRKSTRGLKILALLGAGYVIWSELQRREQEEKIELLASKLDQLEHAEEE